MVFQELRALRDEVSTLRLRAGKCEDLARELESLRSQVAEASVLAQKEGENVIKEQKLQVLSLKEETRRLADEAATWQEKLHAAEDAVRVSTPKYLQPEQSKHSFEIISCGPIRASTVFYQIKSKMLESQNETIKELKSELKEAFREAKTIADTVDSKWHERMRDDLEQVFGIAPRNLKSAGPLVVMSHQLNNYELPGTLTTKGACCTREDGV